MEINSSVESSISFAGLETYLDNNHIQEQGFVDFMPFDFRPFDQIDLNSSSELLATADGYEIFFQEYNDTQNNKTFWTLSIEHGDDEVNASSLVVDMAGFVYNGAFEDSGTTLSASRSMNQILSLSKDIRTGMRLSLPPILMG